MVVVLVLVRLVLVGVISVIDLLMYMIVGVDEEVGIGVFMKG